MRQGKAASCFLRNVHSVGRVASLIEEFPDAKFVFVMRDPFQAVPSLVSLYYAIWKTHSPDIPKDSPESHAVAQMGLDYYRYLAKLCNSLPTDSFICIAYEDLLSDPAGVVNRIYQRFGLPMSEPFRARLRQEAKMSKRRQSFHHYSLDEYGLSAPEICEQLDEMSEFVRLATEAPAARERIEGFCQAKPFGSGE